MADEKRTVFGYAAPDLEQLKKQQGQGGQGQPAHDHGAPPQGQPGQPPQGHGGPPPGQPPQGYGGPPPGQPPQGHGGPPPGQPPQGYGGPPPGQPPQGHGGPPPGQPPHGQHAYGGPPQGYGGPPPGQPPQGYGGPPHGQHAYGGPPQGHGGPPPGQPPHGQHAYGGPPGQPHMAPGAPGGHMGAPQHAHGGGRLPPVKRVSFTFYVVACLGLIILGGALIGWGASDSKVEELLMFAWIPLLVGLIFFYVLIYKSWAAIQDGYARTTPGKAVGFMFIPFFNIYWLFVAIGGYGKSFNEFAQRNGVRHQASEGLFVAHCVMSLLPFVSVLTIITLPMCMSQMCGCINSVADAGAPQVPRAVARTG